MKGISLSLERGQILALIGENGAGKSTLMNLLGGVFTPSDGDMQLNGNAYLPDSPIAAQIKGIAFIHQELNLFPNLSIAENLFINQFPIKKLAGFSLIDRRTMRERAVELLRQVGLQIRPEVKVEELSPAQQQLVEIAKALSAHPQIIIFDEPTTSLSRHEANQLFELVFQLKAKGIAMIYISHNLDDVHLLADRIAVLRDGELVKLDVKEAVDIQGMVKAMVGREMSEFFPARKVLPDTKRLLLVENLTAKGFVTALDFHLNRQEVVGFYGLVGAGRSEMARILYGLDRFDTGNIYLNGRLIQKPNPADSIKNRMAFLTEDRREEGLLLGMDIQKNVQLAALSRFSRGIFRRIDRKRAGGQVSDTVQSAKTRYNSVTGQPVSTLSGGNQQKVVLAKWLLTAPELLILDEPTKGIDIGAKREIYGLINQLVEKGSSVLLISSELEELLGLCDRILVMSQGRITASFTKPMFDRNAILEAALHKQSETLPT
nr:ATP-binding cassette domain-containing protein [Cytophagales bacterium]